MFHGRITGRIGRQTKVQDPKVVLHKSSFRDKELLNFSPKPEYMEKIIEADEMAVARAGTHVAEFKDMIPKYQNINNTDITNIHIKKRP